METVAAVSGSKRGADGEKRDDDKVRKAFGLSNVHELKNDWMHPRSVVEKNVHDERTIRNLLYYYITLHYIVHYV